MKYVVMSHPEPRLKTFRERVQEKTQPLAAQGDLTSALIRYLLEKDRADDEDEDYVRLGEYFPPDSPSGPRRLDRWGRRFPYGR